MQKLIRYSIVLSILFSVSLCYAQADKVDLEPLKISITNGTVTVDTSAIPIPATALSGRKSLIVVNISANNVFLGSSTVTTENGYQLYSEQAVSFDISDDIILYAIAGSSSEIRYIEAR